MYTLFLTRDLVNVHEACTYMNSNNVHNEADGCAFVEWGTGITRNGGKWLFSSFGGTIIHYTTSMSLLFV
jgi:hypothetical protein